MRRPARAWLVALLVVAGCSTSARLTHEAPASGARAYALRWRGAALFVLPGGVEKRARSELRGRLLLERGPGTSWQARLAAATLAVRAAPETGLEAAPPDPGRITFRAFAAPRARVVAEGGERTALAALFAPKTLAIAASFPPVPAGPVKRGVRWSRTVGLSWPHPLGVLRGDAHLRLRLSSVHDEGGRRTAVVRLGGDARLAGSGPAAPAYRGTAQAEVLLDLKAHRVLRAVVEEDWVGAYRVSGTREARVRAKGEWTLKLAQ